MGQNVSRALLADLKGLGNRKGSLFEHDGYRSTSDASGSSTHSLTNMSSDGLEPPSSVTP
jgi:hypothetical protein